jgi:hypothetical protein
MSDVEGGIQEGLLGLGTRTAVGRQRSGHQRVETARGGWAGGHGVCIPRQALGGSELGDEKKDVTHRGDAQVTRRVDVRWWILGAWNIVRDGRVLRACVGDRMHIPGGRRTSFA